MVSALRLTGGRSSVSGCTATVFGASGFLGKYVVSKLGAVGTRVVVPYRGDELYIRHLKPMGDLGAIAPVKTSIRSVEQIQRAVAGSDVVINLLGRHLETRRWSFNDIHVSFPSVLAEVCAEEGVQRLIHMSSIAASLESPSAWARSKAVGEVAVKEAFPEVTILRSAAIFGDEDKFLNKIARVSRHLPFYPLTNAGVARQQPVCVNDVADAVIAALADADAAGQTYHLAGPKTYTWKQLTDFVFKAIGDESNAISVPQSVAGMLGTATELLPAPWLTADEVRLQATDVVLPEGQDPVKGFSELGIEPQQMESLAESYLFMYKKKSPFVEDDKYYVAPPQ